MRRMPCTGPLEWGYALAAPQFWVAGIAFLSGCHSSLQGPSADGPVAEMDGGAAEVVVFDGPDNRRLPYGCEEDTDCNDQDVCTLDECVKGACAYGRKSIDFDPVVLATAASAVDVSLSGGRLFVAEGEGGVEVFNLENPDEPVLEAAVETERPALAVEMLGGELAVSEGENGVELFAVPGYELQRHVEPDTGIAVGLDDVRSIDVGPRYGMASGYADGLVVLNVNDPSHITPRQNLYTQGRAMRTALSSTAAVTADALGGVAVIGFDTPDGIAVTKQIPTEGRVLDVDVVLDTAVFAEFGVGFGLLDLSDPQLPVRLVAYPSGAPVTTVVLIGSQSAIVGDESGRLRLFDVSVQYTGRKTTTEEGEVIPLADAAAPEELDFWKGKGVPVRMDAENGMVVAAMSDGGVVLINTGCQE